MGAYYTLNSKQSFLTKIKCDIYIYIHIDVHFYILLLYPKTTSLHKFVVSTKSLLLGRSRLHPLLQLLCLRLLLRILFLHNYKTSPQYWI
ncbi:hypothetical protein EUTSA_v10005201mg [Eutrema salsugineum]|uniref:Uncharacterized protein n=1 Tax=Eutrema salsugineum TaxID=72664 RepID=V4MJX2_EUTSA|nr:hypothetical protein EUTSA_v10005201mg [Eutrema salsugineum]